MWKLMSHVLVAVALSLSLSTCKHRPTQPDPVPTPRPSGTPTPQGPRLFPLAVSGDHFVAAGGQSRVNLLGAIVCCEGYPANGWPWASEREIQRIADSGGNYVHFRLGPFIEASPEGAGELPEYVAFRRGPSGRYNLDDIDPGYFPRLRDRVGFADRLGVAVELDIADGWQRRHPEGDPWASYNNEQGFDGSGCAAMRRAPEQRHLAWFELVVRETASLLNVIYQAGNENFICGDVSAWEEAIFEIVHSKGKLVGTNSHQPGLEAQADYVNYHVSKAPRGGLGKPLMVNEVSDPVDTPAKWESISRVSAREGVSFHLWRGGMDESEYALALSKIRSIREEFPQ